MAEFKLDAATRKALTGLMPCTQNGTIPYTPDDFEKLGIEDKYRAVYSQRSYSIQERDDVVRLASEGDSLTVEKMYEFGRKTILDWEKIFDLSTGEEIKFKANGEGNPDKELWAFIPNNQKIKIFQNAGKISGLYPVEVSGLKS